MKHILLAYDGTEPSRRALERTGDLAQAFHASVAVVSVVPDRPLADARADADAHERELHEARDYLRARGIEPELFEPAGDVPQAIERVAQAGGFDTIVVGSRGLGALERFVQRSVSEHVARHADATVVVAR